MRRSLLISSAIVGVTVTFVYLAIAVQAAGLVLTVDPADSPLRIHGILDGQTSSFSGNLRLTITGVDTRQVDLLASDLHHATEPETTIDRSSVTTIPAPFSLSNNQPTDIKVTISNVKRAGDYTGTLQFWVVGQFPTQTLTIPLALHVDVKPNIEPVVANQSFQVVRCWWIECNLAEILLGGSATRQVWHIQLDNQASQPVTVTSALVVMHGSRTTEAVTSSQVKIRPLAVLPANDVSTIPVTITRNSLQSDGYQGKLRFNIEGLDETVTINSTLDVRNGPWWALVAVFLGILVGRMARDMETAIAKKQVKLLPRWYGLRTKIDQIINEPARHALESDLQKARVKIDSAEDTEEVASEFLADLETKVSFLMDLQTIEEKLTTLPVDKKLIKQLIDEARSSLLAGEADKAEAARKKIMDLLNEAKAKEKAKNDEMMGLNDEFQKVWSSVLGFFVQPDRPSLTQSKEALDAANQHQASLWRRFLATLSGLQLVTAATRFWFFRPVLSVLLLVLLTLLGLQTLYVNAGATFGVGGLYDYLGLFIWGITADIAQRTLFNLPTT